MTALPRSDMIYDFGRKLWHSTAKALVDNLRMTFLQTGNGIQNSIFGIGSPVELSSDKHLRAKERCEHNAAAVEYSKTERPTSMSRQINAATGTQGHEGGGPRRRLSHSARAFAEAR